MFVSPSADLCLWCVCVCACVDVYTDTHVCCHVVKGLELVTRAQCPGAGQKGRAVPWLWLNGSCSPLSPALLWPRRPGARALQVGRP